jgi:hypothetical protein
LEGEEARKAGGQGMWVRCSGVEMHATQVAKARQIRQARYGREWQRGNAARQVRHWR